MDQRALRCTVGREVVFRRKCGAPRDAEYRAGAVRTAAGRTGAKFVQRREGVSAQAGRPHHANRKEPMTLFARRQVMQPAYRRLIPIRIAGPASARSPRRQIGRHHLYPNIHGRPSFDGPKDFIPFARRLVRRFSECYPYEDQGRSRNQE